MSHFTKVSVEMTDLASIEAAGKAMGFGVLKDTTIRGYQGATTTAQVVFRSKSFDIGFTKRADGTIDIEADWWGVERMDHNGNQEEFLRKLKPAYAEAEIMKKIKGTKYRVAGRTVDAEGNVKLKLQAWV